MAMVVYGDMRVVAIHGEKFCKKWRWASPQHITGVTQGMKSNGDENLREVFRNSDDDGANDRVP